MIMVTHRLLSIIVILLILLFSHQVLSYEKTLRKIVRNQSKMVQRPFSDTGGEIWSGNNRSVLQQLADSIITPGFAQTKVLHRIQRPKMATIISSVGAGRGKSAYSKIFASKNMVVNDLRLARNASTSVGKSIEPFMGTEYYFDKNKLNNTHLTNIAIDTYYQIPTPSKFFPHIEEQELQSLEQKSGKDKAVVFPENLQLNKNKDSMHLKSIFMPKKNNTVVNRIVESQASKIFPSEEVDPSDRENDKADFFLHGNPVDNEVMYNYNSSTNTYVCKILKRAAADIDAQNKFAAFDIEPSWASKKQFWNGIYDSRYESLMRNSKWPPLKVVLVPRSHVDTLWKKSFDQYHADSVRKILANVVKKLHFYPNLTFTWNEVSHLSRWWKNTSHKSRSAFKKLLKSGRLEITTGGWVETDEATTQLFGLVHQLIEGHEWLKLHLDYIPKVGWLTNTVTHSPTMTYLLSTLEIYRLVMTNLHFSWEEYLAEYQYSDFIWLQDWDTDNTVNTYLNEALGVIGSDRYTKNSVITHYSQFNSAGFRACGPNRAICANDFNFARSNLDINAYNIKEKSELLLEQYSKTGTLTSHNTILAPIGAPYAYEYQQEFDYQYNNYEKIADFININQKIYKATIKFGTPRDYFDTIMTNYKKYPTLKGDFLNFADVASGTPAYWAGFYTSRPFFKILLRRLESTMRSTELLFSFALSLNVFREYNTTSVFEKLHRCRENFARLLDRNVAIGTLPMNVLRYAHSLILTTVKDCWYIQEIAASLLTSKPGTEQLYLQKYVYRDGEFISTFKTVSPKDQFYIFNPLSHETTEIIELVTRYPNIKVIDYNKKEVTVQINPIWTYSENVIKISKRFFKITFIVMVPPMALELYKIKSTFDALQNAAAIYCSACVVDDVPSDDSIFPFSILPVEKGDIQLESYKQRLTFDEVTGFLKTVVEKETNTEKTIVMDFGAFRDADVNCGMFLFNTNTSKPLNDILMPYRIGTKTRITMIISGHITTEISNVFGRFLHHTIRIFNLVHSALSNAIYIENKVDYEVSPKYRDLELFMSIQVDIANGNPPHIYIDNNGFQHTVRVLNLSKRIESNMYPITSMAYIQDQRSRLTYLTDHAQGVTALQEGQLVVMLDRRVLYNDGRGAGEGLADSTATIHRQYILLENFRDYASSSASRDLTLPSLTAVYLADSLNYYQDIFIVNHNGTELCHYAFLPLMKMSFPCDVSVVTFRSIRTCGGYQHLNSTSTAHCISALLILHRRSFSCRIYTSVLHRCNGEADFSLDKILRNVKAVYQTNLAGTNKGTPLLTLYLVNFPPMELITLKLYF